MDSDVTEVISKTALIENLLDQIIVNFSSPRSEAHTFFWDILLDSSIFPLGSKIKAVMAITQEINVKIDQDSLHKVVSYRNAFAHHSINSHPTFKVGKTPEGDDAYYMLQTISNSGKTKRIKRGDALVEFNECYKKAKDTLINVISELSKNVGRP